MADKSLITQEQMQSDLEQFYSQKIYPYLNGATHAGFTPVGSVIAIMGNEAPNHYLACDGTLYTIADYPQLTAYFEDQFNSVNYFGGNGTTTFAVPDLRGEFLRGTGTNSHTHQGSGANVGVHQNGTSTGRIVVDGENTRLTSYVSNSNIPIMDTDQSYNTGSGSTNSFLLISASKTGSTDTPNTYTSRPTNTSVLWCIAYENTYIDGSGESSGGGHKIQNEGDSAPLTQRKTMLLNEPLVASDDAEGGNTVVDVDTNVDLSVIQAPGTAGNVEGHIYSTSETVVGKWIDGKPLYEKVVTILSQSDDLVRYDLSTYISTNISTIVYINAITSGGTVNGLVFSDTNKLLVYVSSNNLVVNAPTQKNGFPLNIIIQYTKTTDIA